MEDNKVDATAGAHPVDNQMQASSDFVTVTLVDGRVIENQPRWWSPRLKKFVYEVEVDGELYLGSLNAEGKVVLH